MELASSVVRNEGDDRGTTSRPSIQLELKLVCWLDLLDSNKRGNGCEVKSQSGLNSSESPSLGSRSKKDYKYGDGGKAMKKLRLERDQSSYLEETFKDCTTLTPKQKLAIARRLNLKPRQVEVWFQNRRARTKFKQTEADYEYSKRCCKDLTEENRRLQEEIKELRSVEPLRQNLNAAVQATMPTLCPLCEHAAVV